MIDTHAHLDFKEFDEDREEVIRRFFSMNGRAIVNIGVDLERSRKSIEIAEGHKGVFASVGFHPDFFSKSTLKLSFRVEELRRLAKHEKVVAVGETGLDYFRVKKPDFLLRNPVSVAEIKENQKKGFLAQIEIAKELGLPVIVHCRNADGADSGGYSGGGRAWEDLYEIISEFSKSSTFRSKSGFFLPPLARGGIPQSRTFFVLHCYSGEKKDTEKFLELSNVCFSFSGNITYPKPAKRAEKLAEAVKMIPLDKIMLDSDAPFLAPQVFRGKRNEPAHVKYIAQKIADIKEISVEEVEKTTDENAMGFFRV